MIEEEIYNLIIRMENLGYEFTHDNKDGCYFNFMDGTDGYINIADWDEVESFCDKHEIKED